MEEINPIIQQKVPIQAINIERLKDCGVNLRMARLDRIHPLASGNKIYKLRPIIEFAKVNKYKQILSFGGAFSNHIHALALMAEQHDIESIALIRGEAKYAENPTLSDALQAGMKLEFVTRQDYKLRNDQNYLTDLQKRFPKALIVAEGGSSDLAVQGCAQMAHDINIDSASDFLAIPSGTGATAAGLSSGLAPRQKLMVYSVLKDESLKARIDSLLIANKNQYTLQNADFGGYAKLDKTMLYFILDWLDETGILLDPIYTGKMCRRVIQQIEAKEFKNGQSITLIHSGGLQGWRGMQKKVELLAGNKAWKKISCYIQND